MPGAPRVEQLHATCYFTRCKCSTQLRTSPLKTLNPAANMTQYTAPVQRTSQHNYTIKEVRAQHSTAGGRTSQHATLVCDKPRPPAPKLCGACSLELLGELLEASERGLDGVPHLARGLPPTTYLHALEEERVVCTGQHVVSCPSEQNK